MELLLVIPIFFIFNNQLKYCDLWLEKGKTDEQQTEKDGLGHSKINNNSWKHNM